MGTRLAAVVALALLLACGPSKPTADGGARDASVGGGDGGHDAGAGDGGPSDAGAGDGGLDGDGGLEDGGVDDGGFDGGLDAGPGGCWFSPSWNLAPNGGFECDGGTMAPWQVGGGSAALVGGRDGGWAVRLTVGSGGTVALSTSMPLVSFPPPPAVFCARAWVKGPTGTARLEALRFPVGQADTFSEPLLGAGWQIVPPSVPLSATVTVSDSAYLRLQLLNAPVGSTIDVDDLRVWLSTSQQCPTP